MPHVDGTWPQHRLGLGIHPPFDIRYVGATRGPSVRRSCSATNRHQPPVATNHQPPIAPNHQPPAATNRQPPIATNRQSPPTANRQPLPTANRQSPPTANRHHGDASRQQMGRMEVPGPAGAGRMKTVNTSGVGPGAKGCGHEPWNTPPFSPLPLLCPQCMGGVVFESGCWRFDPPPWRTPPGPRRASPLPRGARTLPPRVARSALPARGGPRGGRVVACAVPQVRRVSVARGVLGLEARPEDQVLFAGVRRGRGDGRGCGGGVRTSRDTSGGALPERTTADLSGISGPPALDAGVTGHRSPWATPTGRSPGHRHEHIHPHAPPPPPTPHSHPKKAIQGGGRGVGGGQNRKLHWGSCSLPK